MEDSLTVPRRPRQNPNHNYLHPHFDGKALTIQSEDPRYRYRDKGIPTVMIQVGVVTEVPMVRTVQGSMAVDQEADRLKVSCCLPATHQPKEQQKCWVHLNHSI